MIITQSKAKIWRKCTQMYHYKYVERLRRRKRKRPFVFGDIVHRMVEADANGENPFHVLKQIDLEEGKMFREEKEMYGDIIEDIRVIMQTYFEFWPERNLRFIRRDGRSAEHKFSLEIEKGLTVEGKIDGLAESPNKFRWLVERKTFSRMPKDEHRWRNLQGAVYIRMVDMLGWLKKRALDGVCWDYIWSKPPTIPNLLKNEIELSAAKVDTLPIVVREEIERLELDPRLPKNRAAMEMAQLSAKEYFHRIFTPVNHKTIDILFQEFIDTGREIAEHHGHKASMNIDFHCDNCEFEGLCRARLQGNDVDFIKEREFYADPQERENPELAD